jgi:hypothetical protein
MGNGFLVDSAQAANQFFVSLEHLEHVSDRIDSTRGEFEHAVWVTNVDQVPVKSCCLTSCWICVGRSVTMPKSG